MSNRDFNPGVQVDAFAADGRGACSPKEARTLLQTLEQVAALHDQQRRPAAPITITRRQARTLAAKLRLPAGNMAWRGHPIHVVEDETKR